MKTLNILIFLLIFNTFILLGYLISTFTGKVVDLEKINVTRAIDGDTLAIDDGQKIRLLGVNTPEKKMLGYEEAKEFLNQLEGKEIGIEAVGENKDRYGRLLRYVFYQDVLINEEILKQGLAHLYVYNEDKYTKRLKEAEESAMNKKLGIWKRSNNFGCIELINLKYKENERCKNQEQIILNNRCKAINLVMKDDSTKSYKIGLDEGIFIKNFSCVWNDAGDSVYMWDAKGLLMFYRY